MSISSFDGRVWALHSFGLFSCKSLFVKIIDNPNSTIFTPHKIIWSACVPLKVKVFVWTLAHKKLNSITRFKIEGLIVLFLVLPQ